MSRSRLATGRKGLLAVILAFVICATLIEGVGTKAKERCSESCCGHLTPDDEYDTRLTQSLLACIVHAFSKLSTVTCQRRPPAYR